MGSTAAVRVRVRRSETALHGRTRHWHEEVDVEVPAHRVRGVHGLLVTRPVDAEGRPMTQGWVITHERSGRAITGCRLPKLAWAKEAVLAIGPLADWTQDQEALQALGCAFAERVLWLVRGAMR